MHRFTFLCSLLLAGLAATGCFRREIHDVQISAPGMESARDVALITNAAQRELMGEMPDIQHECRIDLASNRVHYFEGPRLADTSLQRRMLSALFEAGYPASIELVKHDPTPPLRIAGLNVPFHMWPDRCRMILRIPAMTTPLDANRVTDAIAHARLGGRPINLLVDQETRSITIQHQLRRLSTPLNYAHAIASAGYNVQDCLAYTPESAPPRGWIPYDG